MSPAIRPDRSVELELLAAHELVGGLDEVGRGSLAGPVTVGLAVVSRSTVDEYPAGLADSKQLTARRREALVQPCQAWLTDHAVAHASPAEIDALGIIGALRLAGRRALALVAQRGHLPGVIILDGVADWLTAPAADLFSDSHDDAAAVQATEVANAPAALPTHDVPPVRMEVKGDARCAVVAAASVLAKVERDGIMAGLDDPGYGWAANKGYASATHQEGLARLGASAQHRRSWKLPGLRV
ncbi:ribonuclease HII [Actinomyces trachealis]|uniref:ribonuclease HII n=1 Tax=Actinomyces trachealis TaxID=2763540 RepID=UPI001892920A|nr:ribonuclease HII [Actinomyces trachealis]